MTVDPGPRTSGGVDPGPPTSVGTYRALLIGNSVFDEDAGLHPLNAPVKDVARLHRALVDSDTGMFDDEHVRLVTERRCDDILDELDRFFANAGKDDLLLLYYSGHGVLDERNRLYLCGRDTRSDRLLRTGVSNVRVNEFVAQSMSQRTVIVLDCCSSGMFKGGGVGAQLAGPGRYIVSSTRGADLANDAATATGTSLFTEHLVEGLLGAAPDGNGDGYIDLREVYDYVRTRLLDTTRQVPHCRFDGDAAVSLARVRVAPALARATSARHRAVEPTFALAENMITLRDVEVDEQLRPEVVEVIQLGDDPIDLTAETADDWLHPTVSTDGLVVVLRPRLGRNRGKITVRDRNSGNAQVLRVEAYVQPGTVAKSASQPEPPRSEPQHTEPIGSAPPRAAPPPPEPPQQQAPWAQNETFGQTWFPSTQPPAPPPPPHAPWGADQPRPLPRKAARRAVLWPGGLGAVLLIIGYSGVNWYGEGSEGIDFSSLHTGATQFDVAFAEAYFGALGWLLLVFTIAAALVASLPIGRAATWSGRIATALAAISCLTILLALTLLWNKVRAAGNDVALWKHVDVGLVLTLLGFALLGTAGVVASRRRRA